MTQHGSSDLTHSFPPEVWRDFFGFLRRPSLPGEPSGIGARQLRVAAQLYALDILLMVPLILVGYLVISLGVDLPDTALEGMEIGAGIAFAVIVVAPVIEEIAFRSWLSGKAGHMLAVAVLIACFGLAIVLANQEQAIASALLVLAGVVLAPLSLMLRKGRGPLRFFSRYFGWFFYGSAFAFAAIHLSNYAEGTFAMVAPLLLPQFVGGLVFGFARVKLGLWACILLHALHNGTAIGVVLLAGGGGSAA